MGNQSSPNEDWRRTMFPPLNVTMLPETSISILPQPKMNKNFSFQSAAESTSKSPTSKRSQPEPSKGSYKARRVNQSSATGSITQIQDGDPWSSYHPMIHLDEAGDITGAYSFQDPSVVKLIIRTPTRLTEDWVHELLQIRHEHIVSFYEAFQDTDMFLVCEMMHISLECVIACDLKLREPQIARICAEVRMPFGI